MRQIEEIEHTQMEWEDNNTTCRCFLLEKPKLMSVTIGCSDDAVCSAPRVLYFDHAMIELKRAMGRTLGFRGAGNKIEGLLPLFCGPALHIPFKIFCNPSKRKG
jgi:hypothetical protein